MPDTEKIINAINAGFESINKKIESYDKRITDIEKERAFDKGLSTQKKEAHKSWQTVIRTVSIAGILSLLALAWAKIKAVMDLVP